MIHVETKTPRTELHDSLGLTGAEVSINALPPNAAVPFVHIHKQNEEIYGILEGSGEIWLDGEIKTLTAGDWFKVDPQCPRAIRASNSGMRFVCIQVKARSLDGFTMNDGQLVEGCSVPWL